MLRNLLLPAFGHRVFNEFDEAFWTACNERYAMKDACRPRNDLQLCNICHTRHEQIGNPAIFLVAQHVETFAKTKLSHTVKCEVLEPSSRVEWLVSHLFDLGAEESRVWADA